MSSDNSPVAYGTILATFGREQPKGLIPEVIETNVASTLQRGGFGDFFLSITGERVERDIKRESLEEFHVGDVCRLRQPSLVGFEIVNAKTIVIVGFTKEGNIISQLDGKGVIVDSPSEHRKTFETLSSASKDTKAKVQSGDAKVEMERVIIAVVVFEGRVLEMLLPKGLEVTPGETVTLNMKTLNIVGKALLQMSSEIALIRRVIDETTSEVEFRNTVKIVFNGRFGKELTKGDRVVLDASGVVVVKHLGKDDERFSLSVKLGVKWSDIGGLEEAKQQMIETVEQPHRYRKLFGLYGQKRIKGILLFGPPGCGKTLLGKAVATALSEIYGGAKASEGFIYIKGPEILEKFVGVAEATVRQIFDRARKHMATYGYPAVIFIDEAEALLAKRDSGVSSDVGRTVVPAFLNEMDGLEESGAVVILATNRPDMLDSAVVRGERIDLKIKVTRPTPESTKEIFRLNFRHMRLAEGLTVEDLSELGSAEIFSEKRALYEIRKRDGSVVNFTLKDVLNGGMITNIVKVATSLALRRDIAKMEAEKAKDEVAEKFVSGLTKEDLVAAIDTVLNQSRDLDFVDDIKDFVHDFQKEVIGVEKLRQGRG